MEKSKIILQIDCDSEIALSKHYNCNYYNYGNEVYYNVLDTFKSLLLQHNFKATFFIVGIDMENDKKCRKVRELISQGHEIANHTYHHPKFFSQISTNIIREEIIQTNQICLRKLGVTPRGFRAPDFDINIRTLRILDELEFYYDCSLLFTPWKPLLKLLKGSNPFEAGYLGENSFVFPNEYKKSLNRYGSSFNRGDILELPISTMPYLKFPCNFSYLLALPKNFGYEVFRKLIWLYQKKKEPLIFIFHLADLVDNYYLFDTEAKYYKSLAERLFFVEKVFEALSINFDSITTYEYAKKIKENES